jgi:hypothetical protein
LCAGERVCLHRWRALNIYGSTISVSSNTHKLKVGKVEEQLEIDRLREKHADKQTGRQKERKKES